MNFSALLHLRLHHVKGNTYTNNWVTHSKMVSVEDKGLRGGGYALKQKIWDAAKTTISEWTGQELTQCSLYGVRVYYEGSVLAPHVDRLPLVSSAIINVDQDVDEPWVLEVIGHNGKAENVTMEPPRDALMGVVDNRMFLSAARCRLSNAILFFNN